MPLRHFLKLEDLSGSELNRLIDRAIELKRLWREGTSYEPLRGRSLAMVFEQASTRTRVAFEAGMQQLGGHAIFLSPTDTQFGRGEPVEDTARVLSEMVDLVMIRTPSQETLERFADYSSVPVINAMTAQSHPCQILADIQTFVEQRGSIAGKTVAFVGDGFNMCNSFISAATQFDFHLNIACPAGYLPDPALVEQHSNHVRLCDHPAEAIAGAALVVTDVWSSMGHEEQIKRRKLDFAGYQIDEDAMSLADTGAVFMHCLPAHRGEEVNDSILDAPASVVWQEAGNRLHSQKALMEFLYFEARG